MLNQEVREVLIEHLIEVIEERKVGYSKASEKIRDPYLKMLFNCHADYSNSLLQQLSSSFDGGTFSSPYHGQQWKWKYWYEIKSALKSGNRSELLEACIKGDQRTIDLINEWFNDPHTSDVIKSNFSNQFKEIKKACDQLKIFKISL